MLLLQSFLVLTVYLKKITKFPFNWNLKLKFRRVFVLGRTAGLEESIEQEYSTHKDIVQVNLKGHIDSVCINFQDMVKFKVPLRLAL